MRVRRGAAFSEVVRFVGATASEGRFLGMTIEAPFVFCAFCFEARGFDSTMVVVVMVTVVVVVATGGATVFCTFVEEGFRLRGRLAGAAGFSCMLSFLRTALVTSPSGALLLWALVTSPRAARFRVVAALLCPTLEGRAVVDREVRSVDEASFERVTRVCCTLFSSCRLF